LKRSLVLEAAKKKLPNGKIPVVTLKDHFIKTFGKEDTPTYEAAVDAFMRSLAAYSIISYILQLKDRHNGNILIDNKGRKFSAKNPFRREINSF
jgi:phosphatidylinositol 4-kinase B